MTFALLALRNNGRSSFVRAFSTLTGTTSPITLQRSSQRCPLSGPIVRPVVYRETRWFASSRSSASIEEDLDAALEDILGNAQKEETKKNQKEDDLLDEILHAEGIHMKGSHPIPEDLVEEDDIDFQSPSFLSTSNPYWIKTGIHPSIIPILSQKGISTFTPVQAEAFKPVLAGRDVIGRSRTGTGKTLAFGIPAICRLEELAKTQGKLDQNGRRRKGRLPSMLVLCPTRELARQVQEELSLVGKPLGLFVEVFHGGVSYEPQSRALNRGIDILVGTPGRIIDHLNRRNFNLSETSIVVLDEADEMLNMGFADDVETILEGIGSSNDDKTQCLMFSATTPPWVKQIGRKYQNDVLMIDSTAETGGARTATTVRHCAIRVPPGRDSRKAILEDVIAVEISKDAKDIGDGEEEEQEVGGGEVDLIAKKAMEAKRKTNGAMQQKIFGKTIVFTETKRDADELVSGNVFKSLTAQALHGDVGQKQRDATLNAFRAGAFNVLVATDVAARGIDIQDVDLVVQLNPPRDVDTYVHRSGRTGRAGLKGTSVLLFSPQEARDIVKIERGLGHGFKFDLAGLPSIDATLTAAAKTSAVACQSVPEETAKYFRDAAKELLEGEMEAEDVVARCLAAISRRSTEVQSRSLLTGEMGMATIEMSNEKGRPVGPGDVMFTVGKLSRMSQKDDRDLEFESDVGKIQSNQQSGTAVFDMTMEDAKKLVEFSEDIDAGGASFQILKEIDVNRGKFFGAPPPSQYRRGGGGGGRFNNRGPPRRRDDIPFDRSSRYHRGGGRDEYRGSGGGRDKYRSGGSGRNEYRGGGERYDYRGGGGRDEYRGGGGRGGNRRAGNNYHGGGGTSRSERGYRGRYQGGDDGW